MKNSITSKKPLNFKNQISKINGFDSSYEYDKSIEDVRKSLKK